MTASAPRLVLPSPDGWADDTNLPPPDLSQSPQLAVTRWEARSSRGARLVVGCFEAEVDAWVEEADTLAQDKLASVVVSTAERAGIASALRSEARGREGDVRVERLRGDGDAAPFARTWLGFDQGRVHACFALCGGQAPAREACSAALDGARLEGGAAAPPPSLSLRTLVWVVHHPEAAASALAGVLLLIGLLAITTRPRPRRRRTVSPSGAVSRTRP